ncbi:MAG TPA: O-antigen ligase family protein [Candidatus Portnoybacteria bacterium]|nr:O-antigen ligase family protein [Candidatus Portnoybacteria bacterium]
MSKRLDSLLLAAFSLLVAYLPFQLALNLTSDIDLMSGRILILGLFFVWLIKEFSQNKERLVSFIKEPASIFLITLFSLAALSILVANNQVWGMRKLLVFASIFPLFWLVKSFIKNAKDWQKLAYVILGGAIISALVALAQFLGQFIFGQEVVMGFWTEHILPLFSGAQFGSLVAASPSWQVAIGGQTIMRAIGLFPDPHMLSFYLGLTSPLALAWALFSKKRRLVFFIIYFLLFIVLLLTFSRGGYLGVISSLIVLAFFGGRSFGAKAKKFFFASLMVAAVIFLFFGWPVVSRLFSSFDLSEGSNAGRLAIWQDSIEVIKKSPLLGVGLGNYSLSVGLGQDYRNSITSHNLYLDILAETGLLGLASWLLLFWAAIKAAIKKIDQAPVVAFGILGALAYFLTHSFFESAIFNPTVLAFLMVVLGLAVLRDEAIISQEKN